MQHVLCFCNKIKEFLPILHYIECLHDILADNLCRLHCLVTLAQMTKGKNLVEPAVVSDDEDDMFFLTQEYSCFHNDELVEMIECCLKLPETHQTANYSLNYAHIWELQQQDKKWLVLHSKYPNNYIQLKLDDDVDDIITQSGLLETAFPEEMVLDTVK